MKYVLAILLPLALAGCADTAIFATGTDIGIVASATTQQAQIGYSRVELFQGPNYPDVGDAPAAVGFLGSDLDIFQPHIRQLYATGDAAALVTASGSLAPCPATGVAPAAPPYTTCNETPAALSGERRALFVSTGTNLGLKLGFTGTAPSSIKLGYDREETSIIPLHKVAPTDTATSKPDKYTSVLASIDMNVKTASVANSGLKVTQFFATGAAARNLAKNPQMRSLFNAVAAAAIDPDKVAAGIAAIPAGQATIDKYFAQAGAANFPAARDALFRQAGGAAALGVPPAVQNAASVAAFDAELAKPGNAPLVPTLSGAAVQLNPSLASP